MIYSLESIYKIDTDYNCGDIDIEFWNADGSDIDPALFSTGKFGDNNVFTILKQPIDVNQELLGSYPIKYRVFLAEHPEVSEEWRRPFTVTIANPCD